MLAYRLLARGESLLEVVKKAATSRSSPSLTFFFTFLFLFKSPTFFILVNSFLLMAQLYYPFAFKLHFYPLFTIKLFAHFVFDVYLSLFLLTELFFGCRSLKALALPKEEMRSLSTAFSKEYR